MSDYISRETLVDAIEGIDWFHTNNRNELVHGGTSGMKTFLPTDEVERVVMSIPAADVVTRDCYDRLLAENDELQKVRPVVRGRWEKVGEQMLINLENAREQYAALGYPHRKIFNLRCSSCRMVTMVDSSIAYDYCPHCGADMRGES